MQNNLCIGDKVCFVDPSRVPITEESAAGCLKVVGFDDGYASDEVWAVVTRCDDADFVYAGGQIGGTPYVATWFDNLRKCDQLDVEVDEEVSGHLNALVKALSALGYEVDIQVFR